MPVIKTIKKDAIVKIEVGTAFIERLHNIISKTAETVTPEQIEKFKQLLSKNEPLTENWMDTISTLSGLIKLIEAKAEEQGFVEEMNLGDYLNKASGAEIFNKEGDSLLPQSPEQPE